MVSNCVVSGQSLTVTLAGTKANFYVAVVGVEAWAASATNTVAGEQKNFGDVVLSSTTVAEDKYTMNTDSAAGDNKAIKLASNTPTEGEFTVTRSPFNTMDVGMVAFEMTVKNDWGLDKDSMIMVSFPTYYILTLDQWVCQDVSGEMLRMPKMLTPLCAWLFGTGASSFQVQPLLLLKMLKLISEFKVSIWLVVLVLSVSVSSTNLPMKEDN